MSKGSKQRPTNRVNFDSSWDRIFGDKISQDEKKISKKKPHPSIKKGGVLKVE
tara:strand:- start:1019 stop:1177 length:159 start_codon:yes stop_codon:yes gene_type:complete